MSENTILLSLRVESPQGVVIFERRMLQIFGVRRDKAALLIVDDVWNVMDIGPFLVTAPRSRLLFTTRNQDIAAALGAQQYQVKLLSEQQSWQVFAKWAGIEDAKPGTIAHLIVFECRGLALTLAMVGAMLRDKPAAKWERTLRQLRSADLAKIAKAFPHYSYPNVFAAIQVSVDALEPAARARYCSLAVLLEEMPASREIQEILWGVDESEAAETSESFISMSLAQREADGESIKLHDLQLDYLVARYPDRDTLAMIRGAVRLSSHVILKDPSQFASQMLARLSSHASHPAIRSFLEAARENAPIPWLRLRLGTLDRPGSILLGTLEGHTGRIWGVAMNWDGSL